MNSIHSPRLLRASWLLGPTQECAALRADYCLTTPNWRRALGGLRNANTSHRGVLTPLVGD